WLEQFLRGGKVGGGDGIGDNVEAVRDVSEIGGVVVDDLMRSLLCHQIDIAGAGGGGDFGALLAGELDQREPDAAGAAEYEYGLARLELGPAQEVQSGCTAKTKRGSLGEV